MGCVCMCALVCVCVFSWIRYMACVCVCIVGWRAFSVLRELCAGHNSRHSSLTHSVSQSLNDANTVQFVLTHNFIAHHMITLCVYELGSNRPDFSGPDSAAYRRHPIAVRSGRVVKRLMCTSCGCRFVCLLSNFKVYDAATRRMFAFAFARSVYMRTTYALANIYILHIAHIYRVPQPNAWPSLQRTTVVEGTADTPTGSAGFC